MALSNIVSCNAILRVEASMYGGYTTLKNGSSIRRIRSVLLLTGAFIFVVGSSHASFAQAQATEVEKLIEQMTLEEKVLLVRGDWFQTHGIPRLGIPAVKTADASSGFRGPPATAFPALLGVAATWNPELVAEISQAVASEMRADGVGFLLGPCVNIARAPEGGRNFECMGEDPVLTSRLANSYIDGVKRVGLIPTIKHFALNNQETDRHWIDVKADERTIFEIYLPAFRSAVAHGVDAVMSAYNRVNGSHMSEHRELVAETLKGKWGFTGLVMTDWDATFDTVKAALAGTDLEMPFGAKFERLPEAISSGQLSIEILNDKVRRILGVYSKYGYLGKTTAPEPMPFDRAKHERLARQAAAEAMVLLKNEGRLLPVDLSQVKSIAVIGPNAAVARYGGGGSSQVSPFRRPSPLAAIKEEFGSRATVRYAMGTRVDGDLPAIEPHWLRSPGTKNVHGLSGEYFSNDRLEGQPVLKRLDSTIDFDWGDRGMADARIASHFFSARWTGIIEAQENGEFDLVLTVDNTHFRNAKDGARLYLGNKLVLDNWDSTETPEKKTTLKLKKGQRLNLRVEYHSGEGGNLPRGKVSLALVPSRPSMQEAIDIAKKSDLVIAIVGTTSIEESEEKDRATLNLPGDQDRLISELAKVNPRTVVVLQTGGPVVMGHWLKHVPTVLETWFPGQEGPYALVDVLTGRVNPSGKLPMTFPKAQADSSSHGNFPGADSSVTYAEGIFVGYRYFDRDRIEPEFPFGHGLSYTRFKYSNLAIDVERSDIASPLVTVSFDLTNEGSRAGAEAAQVYVGERAPSVPRPPQELKNFTKVFLQPHETKRVTLRLRKRAFAHYDVITHSWKIDPGKYDIMVGSSSRDHRVHGEVAFAPLP
jgi:beta-glucosidase